MDECVDELNFSSEKTALHIIFVWLTTLQCNN